MMEMDRRKFLKVIGISSIAAIGSDSLFELIYPKSIGAIAEEAGKKGGIQWAIAMDMNLITDEILDRCIEECHKLHNVPNIGNSEEEIKWIWKEEYEHAFPDQKHEYVAEKLKTRLFPLLCNQCTNPPCVRVCPTKATWKRKDGIVMMDWHRCIGCRFCMAACPFGARSFNWWDPRKADPKLNPEFPTNIDYPTRTKGVVEKCTFCNERIDKGQIPKCVEVANEMKEGSMIFGNILDSESEIRSVLNKRFSLRRKPELGTGPNIFYMI